MANLASNFECGELSASELIHLPIVAHFARRLGLVETINALVPCNMAVEPGVIVLGMVLDTLSGRSPLYHLEETFSGCDRNVLFGESIDASYFNDDNVGRVLDCLFKAGTQKLFSAVSVSALQEFSLATDYVHFDTTSVNVFGDYVNATADAAPFAITHGYSKDHRPDLKQFIVSLLCVGTDVPIVAKLDDGNASDKNLNHRVLSEVAQHLNRHGIAEDGFIYVADAAMVTEANLKQAGNHTRFITRLPATYSEHARVIEQAVASDQWTTIGALAQSPPTKNRPPAQYRTCEASVTLYGQQYRALVVHSSSHDRRRHKRLERATATSLTQARERAKAYGKKRYACAADAQAGALECQASNSRFHRLSARVEEIPTYARGRPSSAVPRTPISVAYGLIIDVEEDESAIDREKHVCGCFVLLSNVSTQEHTSEQVLRAYKEQHGIEKNFGFLKDDQIVNALFLKNPERIEALGLILMLSLLIWRLVEHTMRTNLERRNAKVKGWDNKPTQRPTGYMLTWKFHGVLLVALGKHKRLARSLTEIQKEFLAALDVPESCFWTHPDTS